MAEKIEAVTEENLSEVLPLIREYQRFYNVSDISDEKNAVFFSQFHPDSSQGCQFVCRKHGEIVAFATVYFSFASTITAKVAILNDLFTLPEKRGYGYGRKLIEHCRHYAAEQGAARLQWVTAQDNAQAQLLYNSMDAKQSTWHMYVCTCD